MKKKFIKQMCPFCRIMWAVKIEDEFIDNEQVLGIEKKRLSQEISYHIKNDCEYTLNHALKQCMPYSKSAKLEAIKIDREGDKCLKVTKPKKAKLLIKLPKGNKAQ